MLFNSLTFFLFFGCVLSLYFLLPHRGQNRMLLVASYFFYGWWDWRFLSLIFISTVTDYICGAQIRSQVAEKSKRRYLQISVITNLAILGSFKYFNFFIENLITTLSAVGLETNIDTLYIILPVGISFYTFQTMSYTIDIFRGELEPTDNFFDFALFVSFFPQLVAGPIERAKNLLPQIQTERYFEKAQFIRGLHLIFWGLFKKVFVADNLGIFVDDVFGNLESTGMEYVLGSWAFAFQIYGDFSGYSDIARGVAKCLGFELMHNFRQPYFAVNPSDLWRRWHISLTSWLIDYLYIPLGGSRKGPWKTYRNVILTMTLCGLWHGAGWNFILWGFFQGVVLVGHRLSLGFEKKEADVASQSLLMYMMKAFLVFQSFCIGLLIFRSQNLSQMKLIFFNICTNLNWTLLCSDLLRNILFYSSIPAFVMGFQTLNEIRPHWFQKFPFKFFVLDQQSVYFRSFIYSSLSYLLCLYGAEAETFFYFQF